MELLSEFDTSDPVSELLHVVRVRSTVYCRSLMRSPWGFGVEAHGNPAFHVVTSGRCWLEIDAEADQTALAAGALVDLQANDDARVRALGDPQIARAIALIHGQPERTWAVGELASEVALSRSEFAARFRDLVGESVLRYLTRTRLARAAVLLRTSDASLAQIAARTGYGTPFSFGKAFKRMFGIAPGAYRGQANGRPNLELVVSRRREKTR